ncbi:Hint domain-containing protein [Thalassovita litoralis]|uniref:Hint domain-containing protein n=1 Tax=Thalassovita litoralis TaxID=1010611 RepID=A0A521AMQ4_9RHOB|nr:Hint domain-containing protein [Thalassovita litoralis]SMO35930.1 Hint domain-containing protein [Thalassovita litoralis]
MSWIGLTDKNTALFHMAGLDSSAAPHRACAPAQLLPRGTLMLETGIPAHDRPQTLLRFHHLHPWERGLSLQSLPDGAMVLVITQGDTVSHTVLHHGLIGQGHRLRVTYVWDAPARAGHLSIKAIGTGQHYLKAVHMPVPLSLGDLQAVFQSSRNVENWGALDPEVTFLALSDRPQPVGPMPTLAPDLPILTSQGYRPLDHVERGDLIVTPTREQVPVLANLRFRAPARGSFRPVRLRAPYFGLQRNITVAPDQRLCASGSDVEFLFGSPCVLVPARHLVNGVSASYADSGPLATWHQLLLPGSHAMIGAGAKLQSLYLGRMRRHAPKVAVSLLAGYDRSRLPEHASPPYPVLRPFEAVTLVQHRAA